MQTFLALEHEDNNQYAATSRLIRESMLILPKWLQPFITWLTAKPLENTSKSVYMNAKLYYLSYTIGGLVLAVLLSIIVIQLNYLLLLPITLIFTVSSFRKLQVVIYHHCSHNNVLSNKRLNFILGEAISILLLIKNFRTYQKDHMLHHNAHGLLTELDETVQDLQAVGLRPGLPKSVLYRKLLISFISPWVHLKFLYARIKSTFFSSDGKHNAIAASFYILLTAIITYFQAWKMVALIWLLPLTILYHISRTLRLVVEHTWPDPNVTHRNRDFISAATVAVFCGEIVPCAGKNVYKKFLAYSFWLFKMMTLHLFTRIFILVGDTPCHDFHHRNPSAKNWLNYINDRDEDQSVVQDVKQPYREIWGFLNAIDFNLEAMSNARGLYAK